jgi:hypothetical protein
MLCLPACLCACRGPACNAPYWQYSAWSACNATCGGGTATRTATCEAPSGATCAAASRQALEQDCNTAACEVYAWQAGEWSACSQGCGGGTQTRPVSCINPAGGAAADELCSAAGAAMPLSEQRCNLQPCDFCASNKCFNNGFCADAACTCSPGSNATGAYCQVGALLGAQPLPPAAAEALWPLSLASSVVLRCIVLY